MSVELIDIVMHVINFMEASVKDGTSQDHDNINWIDLFLLPLLMMCCFDQAYAFFLHFHFEITR